MTSTWKRAAALGSLWAASEIVLGGLLHGLRVPLAGTLLAAIGVSILVAGLRLRGEPGVAIRAGLLCALMKSVSPSAVILGPMVGIMLEASIVEVVTRLTRRTVPGFFVAGALATATPIVQKIGALLVTYGADAANVYIGLYEFTAAALGVRALGPINLILVFLGAAALLGIVAAAAGVRIATITRQTAADPIPVERSESPFAFEVPPNGQPYSIPLLAIHLPALGIGLALIALTPLWLAAFAVALYALLSFLRYRRVARRFANPKLWVEFGVIAVLAAVALGALSPQKSLMDGLQAGGQMVARGILVIVALSCISVELRNPVVLGWFLGKGLGGAADALSIAARVLPGIMRLFGDEREALRHPVRAISRSLAAMLAWIDRSEALAAARAPVFILSGAQGIGKTAKLAEVVRLLRADGIEPQGFLSQVVLEGENRLGYDLHILSDRSTMPLARTHTVTATSVGPFGFFDDAIRAGRDELDRAHARASALIIVDEIGPLEMRGGGWTPALLPLFIERTCPLLLVVRPSLVNDVCSRWDLEPVEIWDASVIDARAIWTDLRLAFTDRTLYSHAASPYLAGVPR